MKKLISPIISAVFTNAVAFAQDKSSDESAAITKTALDYIEGWYAGDAAALVVCLGRAGRVWGVDAYLAKRWPKSPLW
jgi:cysteine synthase